MKKECINISLLLFCNNFSAKFIKYSPIVVKMKKSLYYTGVVGGSLVAALGFTGMMGEAIVARNKPEPVRIYSPPDPSSCQAY